MKMFLCGSVAFFCLLQFTHAEILLQDSFDYTNGPLVTVSGGRWQHHSGTVTGEVSAVSGRIGLSANNTEDVSAFLSGQPYSAAGTTNAFYASFTVRFTSLPGTTGTYFAHFKDASTTGFRARIWAFTGEAAPGKFRIGLSSTSGSVISATNATDLSLNTDYTVVTRLINSNSVSKLWINPMAESDPCIVTADAATSFTVTAYAFRENSGEGVLTVDDLRVGTSFIDVVTNAPSLQLPIILSPPQNQSVAEHETAVFSVIAGGQPAPAYQWRFNGVDLSDATNSVLMLTDVAFEQSGFYSVAISNALDSLVSQPVTLNVLSQSTPSFSLLTYNAHGNGALIWTTNTSHVQAIGRQIQYLDPDIITFQEIPVTNNGTAEMANFVAAFRPGFFLATNSADDQYIRSVILSRFPIVAERSWLHAADLSTYGYSLSGFTRDLFEVEVSIPGFAQPLHVFTVHLKSGQDSDSATKRAAEAGAISNFFVTTFLTTNGLQPYLLTGDMNEDILRPPASDPQSLERLTTAATGLRLTTPFDPMDRDEQTFSIQSADGLTHRYDYILPCGLLFSNVVGSEVFRTDLLNPIPLTLKSNDDRTASDHLPVLMRFGNPYSHPFRLISLRQSNQMVTIAWESVPGQPYVVETSSNLVLWSAVVSNLTATRSMTGFVTNTTGIKQFFRIRREGEN